MFMLKKLTDPALKRLYKFVLKRLIGRFLLEELDLDQLDVHLRAGQIELCDLALDSSALNEHLIGMPFRVSSGYVGSVKVAISYTNIMKESCVIEVDEVDIVLVPGSPSPATSTCNDTCNNPQVSPSSEDIHIHRENEVDASSREGLDFVASWIEQISSKIKLTVSNLRVKFEDDSNGPTRSGSLLFSIQWIQLTDETPMEHQHFHMDTSISENAPIGGSSFNGSNIGSSSMLAIGLSHKGIKFRGLCAELQLPVVCYDEEPTLMTSTVILDSDRTRQCYIQLKIPQYLNCDMPQIDADIFIHAVRVQLQPCHCKPLGHLMDAYATETDVVKPTNIYVPANSICESNPKWMKPSDEEDEGTAVLTTEEFKRIEMLLMSYQKAQMDLSIIRSSRASVLNNSAPVLGCHISSADTIESGGLSDLEEDFFECETGTSVDLVAKHIPNDTDASLYVSAHPMHPISRRRLLCRFKVHLLECEISLMYADLPPSVLEDKEKMRKAGSALPPIDDIERLIISAKDIMVSWLGFSLQTSCTLSVGSCNVKEFFTTGTNSESESLIEAPILRFSSVLNSGKTSNLPAQLNIQMRMEYQEVTKQNEAEKIELSSSCLEVQCIPIVLEWDMATLRRLENYLSLLEADQDDRIDGLVQRSDVKKLFSVSTELVQVSLRFPLVPSDSIRYGPSSSRGLCEDHLLIILSDLRLSSELIKGVEIVHPWLSKYLIEFASANLILKLPAQKDDLYANVFTEVEFLKAVGVDDDKCSMSIVLQNPSYQSVKLAANVSQKWEDDGGNVRPSCDATTISSVGPEQSQDCSDAIKAANILASRAQEASQYVIDVTIPSANLELSKSKYDRLLVLVDALLTTGVAEEGDYETRNPHRPCYMSFGLTCRRGTLLFHDALDNYSYLFAFRTLQIFQVSQWLGRPVSHVHVRLDDTTLYECTSKEGELIKIPILYRTSWAALNESDGKQLLSQPILFVTVEMSDVSAEMRDVKLSINFSKLSLRYTVESGWLFKLLEILMLDYPLPVVPLDSPSQPHIYNPDAILVTLPTEQRTVFTKLFVNCFDGHIDFAPHQLSSRVVISIGKLRMSSNMVTGAMLQGYKFIFQDIALYLTNDRSDYSEEDATLCSERLKEILPPTAFSVQEHLENRGFVRTGILDSADIFLRSYSDAKRGAGDSSDAKPRAAAPPEMSIELCLGNANIYTCFDSCSTLLETGTVWWMEFSSPDVPPDTSAYVGVNRVSGSCHDLSSDIKNDVVVELGPSQNSGKDVITDNVSAPEAATGIGGPGLLGVMAQVEENAFGGHVNDIGSVQSDTEARLMRTQMNLDVHSDRSRSRSSSIEQSLFLRKGSVTDQPDDELSASQLRAKYSQKPGINVADILIEDYYTMVSSPNRQPYNVAWDSQPRDGATAERTTRQAPWFTNSPEPNRNKLGTLLFDQPTDESEQVARWLPDDQVRAESSCSGIFEVADDSEGETDEIPSMDVKVRSDASGFSTSSDKAVTVESDPLKEDQDVWTGKISAPVPRSARHFWWGGEKREMELESKDDRISLMNDSADHIVDTVDVETNKQHDDGVQKTDPLSMSLIGSGEDEGTEVELDFALDGILQSELTRLLNLDTSDDVDDYQEDDTDETSTYRSSGVGLAASYAESAMESDMLSPLDVHQTVSCDSESAWSQEEAAVTGDQPSARWFYSADAVTKANGGDIAPPLRIYPHHVEIPLSGSAVALSFGEKEADFALRTVAADQNDQGNSIRAPRRLLHVLLRDFSLRWRLFGGSDWPESRGTEGIINTQRQANIPPVDKTASSPSFARKDRLLDALLDNYVPTDADTKPQVLKSRETVYTNVQNVNGRRKKANKSGRRTEQMLEVCLSHIQARIDNYAEDDLQPLASSIVVAARDFEVLDYISTSQIRKLLCYWKSETHHPRETGTNMLRLHLMALRPGPKLCEEHRLRIRILPLRVNLDQHVIDFVRSFFPSPALAAPSNSQPYSPSVQSAIDASETDINIGGWFFQSCDVRSLKIKIDYRPSHVNYSALRAGEYLEIINLFVLDGMELVLRRVKLSGIDGWGALGEAVLMSWVSDISRHQIHKCVASVSMPPLRSMSNIGSGVADLILLPMEQYSRDRRIVKGLKRGAMSFLKSVTIETLNTASKVARGTKSLLEHADDVVSSDKRRLRKSGKASRNNRSGNRSAASALTQPSGATEGFSQAYDSLSREIQSAAKTIVAIPLIEYKKTGPQGYVKSVIRAVPVAVLRPMIGATDAISRALIGVRNAVDPETKEDMENKFKDIIH